MKGDPFEIEMSIRGFVALALLRVGNDERVRADLEELRRDAISASRARRADDDAEP